MSVSYLTFTCMGYKCLCQIDLYHTCYLCTGLIQPLLHVIKRASQIIPKWFYPIWYHPNMLFTSMVNSSYFLNIIDSSLSCVFTESVPLFTMLSLGISTSHLLSKTYSNSESCWGLVCYAAPKSLEWISITAWITLNWNKLFANLSLSLDPEDFESRDHSWLHA